MSFGCNESLGGGFIVSFGVRSVVELVWPEVEVEVDGRDEVGGRECAVEGRDGTQDGGGGANRLRTLVLHAKTWCIPHGM